MEPTVHARLSSFLTNAICTTQQQSMPFKKVEHTCLRSTNYSEQFMHTHHTAKGHDYTLCTHFNQSATIHWQCANELAATYNWSWQCVIALCEYNAPNAQWQTEFVPCAFPYCANVWHMFVHCTHTFVNTICTDTMYQLHWPIHQQHIMLSHDTYATNLEMHWTSTSNNATNKPQSTHKHRNWQHSTHVTSNRGTWYLTCYTHKKLKQLAQN